MQLTLHSFFNRGKSDSLGGVEGWIKGRFALLDEYLSFDPNNICEIMSYNQAGIRKVIWNNHFYIIEDGKTYSIDAKRVR